MRAAAGRLVWRTLAVLVAALVVSQAAAWFLFDHYVTRPRIALNVGTFVGHLKTIDAALQAMDTPQREAFIKRIGERDGIRVVQGPGETGLRPAPDRPWMKVLRARLRNLFGPQADVFTLDSPEVEAGGRSLWIRLAAREGAYWVAFPRQRLERDTATAFVAWGLVSLAVAILGTFFLVRKLNRPLEELARAAVRLGRGESPPPVAQTGPSEIREVARAFNQMQRDLEKNARERATFLAGISHDLRTPLARLRLDVEMLEGKVEATVPAGMVADIDDMNAIIDQFIDFTRSEASEPLSGVNLSELARSCAERAARTGLDIRCELGDLPLLMLRPLALQRLVDNLIANAARHAGGTIQVRTAAGAGEVSLAVLDRGPGIPAAMVEHLKQPFTRRDEARSGSSGAGLGLAIVNRVAVLHGGRLDLLPREGGGLEARVTLPAGAEAPGR